MAVGWQTSGKVVVLTAFENAAKYISLHTGDPGTTGANELTGGTPAYGAVATAWTAPTVDTAALSNQPTFNVPAGVTITHMAYRDAATGGNVLVSRQLPNAETYAGQGTYTLTSAAETLNT
jgi:hypothetical protein